MFELHLCRMAWTSSECIIRIRNRARAGVFNKTQDWEELLTEFSHLYPVEVLKTLLDGSLKDPDFDVTSLLPSGVAFSDPEFFNDAASNVSSAVTVLHASLQRNTCHAYIGRQG
jgi:hypothetical protein